MIAELFLAHQGQHGEGMLVQSDLNRISWVDILGKQLLIADLKGKDLEVFPQESEIAAVLPTEGHALILLLRNNVVWFDPTSGGTRQIWSAGTLEPDTNRFNDAAVDPFGNLWIGSMDFDATAPSGNLYRLSPGGKVDVIDQGYACLNGPAFSGDGTTVYVGDTMAGRVLAYDIDPPTQSVTNKRTFIQFGPFDGLPDGMTVDADGNIWVCQITAGRIACFAPDGTKLRSVALPVPMVTSCCFGGADMSELFATTSRIILDPADLQTFPQSGSLYRIQTEQTGLVPNRFFPSKKETPDE